MRFSLPDLFNFNFNELGSAKTRSFSNCRIHYYANVPALDAVSPSMVASSYLMPAGKTLYASRTA